MDDGQIIYTDESDKCQYYECDDTIVVYKNKKITCEKLEKKTCANGFKPVLHYDSECNCQMECECKYFYIFVF